MVETAERVDAVLWTDGLEEHVGARCVLEVSTEDSGPSRVMLHTFIDGRGSMVSFELDRERVIDLAAQLLAAVALR
jgi:hypothetical protein